MNPFISYPLPVIMDENRYQLFEPRDYQNLTISVNSNPRGAEVFIDGFRTGYSTPYTFGNISDGPHRIMVTKDGYLPQQKLIDLPHYSVPVSMTPLTLILKNTHPDSSMSTVSRKAGRYRSITWIPGRLHQHYSDPFPSEAIQ